MVKVKVPKIGTVVADNGYGASDVGARWVVKNDAGKIGMLSYNGRFEGQLS